MCKEKANESKRYNNIQALAYQNRVARHEYAITKRIELTVLLRFKNCVCRITLIPVTTEET
jgi:hypothetical protein